MNRSTPAAISAESEKGFSLPELMIAITLGLLLLTAVVKIFVSSNYAYTLQQGSARAQESGRAGLFILERVARQAGYYYDPTTYQIALSLFPANQQPVSGIEGGTNPDTLAISYMGNPDGTIVDCLGNSIAAAPNIYATSTFTLSAVNPTTNARQLICTRNIPNATPPVVADSQTLMEGIVDFQVLYGIDTNGDGIADQYVQANAVANWAQVLSLRISLTANSLDSVGAGASTGQRLTQTYNQTIDLRSL